MNSLVFGQLLEELQNGEKELHSRKQGSYASGDDDVLTNFKDQVETVQVKSDMHAALILMEKHRLVLLEVALGHTNESEKSIRGRVKDIRLYMALFYGLWLDEYHEGVPPFFVGYDPDDLEADEPEEESLADWKEVTNSPMLGCLVDLPSDAVVRIKGTLYSFALDDESYRTLDEAIPDQLIFGDDVTKDQKIRLIMDLTVKMIKSGEIPSECKDCPEIEECFLHHTTDPDPETPTPLQKAWRSAMEVAVEDEKENIAIDDFLADQLDEVRDEGAVKDWVRVGWVLRFDGTLDEYVAAIEAMGEDLPVDQESEGIDKWLAEKIEEGTIDDQIKTGTLDADDQFEDVPVMDQGGPVAEGLDKVIADMIEEGFLEVVAPEVVPEKDPEDLKVELGPASLLNSRTLDFFQQSGPLSFEEWDRLRQAVLPGQAHTVKNVAKNPIVAECGRFPESCGDCSLDMCNAHPSNSGEVRQEYSRAEDAAILAQIQEACKELGVEGFEGFDIFDEDPRIGDLRKRGEYIKALTDWLGDQMDQLRADTIDLMEEKDKREEDHEDGGLQSEDRGEEALSVEETVDGTVEGREERST